MTTPIGEAFAIANLPEEDRLFQQAAALPGDNLLTRYDPVLCQDIVSTPRTYLNGDFVEHNGDDRTDVVINLW